MQTILVGVSSGIAAYKIIDLVKNLKKKYNVIVIMTEHAKKIISPDKFNVKVITKLFPKNFNYKKVLKERKVKHISLADKADLILLAPATANIIGKLANGIADDLLTTTILASRAPVLICPTMNVHMWNKKIVQENIKKLKHYVLEPGTGKLACGYDGKGRLAENEIIENEINIILEKRSQLKGQKVIVTTGATVEDIDDIRFITNRSSGKMGIAIAEEFYKRGANVTLIKAPTLVEPNPDLKTINIRTADELEKQLLTRKADIIIHAAAVSDFKIEKKQGKIISTKELTLKLKPRTKIIDKLRTNNPNSFIVGFKASNLNLETQAKALLKRTKANLIVANEIKKSFGKDQNEVILIDKSKTKLKKANKSIIASQITDHITNKLEIKAYAPANISLIFQTYKGKNPRETGSLGVGFTIDRGAIVKVKRSHNNIIKINGKRVKFPTVETVIYKLTKESLQIDIESQLPFGCGFGMSGASALASALAINKLLNLNKTNKQLAMLAHESEVENLTGLGDIAAQYHGGFLFRKKRNGPLDVQHINIKGNLYYKVFGPIETKKVISSKQKLKNINQAGHNAMNMIKKTSSINEIFKIAREFSIKSKLITKNIKHGCMIMLGDAIISLKKFPGSQKIKIETKGARLL